MAKKTAQSPEVDDRVHVEVLSRFRHDTVYVNPGETLVMSAEDARGLMAMNFVRPKTVDGARR